MKFKHFLVRCLVGSEQPNVACHHCHYHHHFYLDYYLWRNGVFTFFIVANCASGHNLVYSLFCTRDFMNTLQQAQCQGKKEYKFVIFIDIFKSHPTGIISVFAVIRVWHSLNDHEFAGRFQMLLLFLNYS